MNRHRRFREEMQIILPSAFMKLSLQARDILPLKHEFRTPANPSKQFWKVVNVSKRRRSQELLREENVYLSCLNILLYLRS